MLKAFSVYDREAGPREGAFLVFANSSKEARQLAWPSAADMFCCEWIDLTTNALFQDTEMLADQEGIDLGGDPLVIESPKSCASCELWGEVLNSEGLCESCVDWRDNND